jgi:hypothetical protein
MAAVLALAAAGPADAYSYYMLGDPIEPVSIVTPTPMVRGAAINEEVQFVCTESWDTDCLCFVSYGYWYYD